MSQATGEIELAKVGGASVSAVAATGSGKEGGSGAGDDGSASLDRFAWQTAHIRGLLEGLPQIPVWPDGGLADKYYKVWPAWLPCHPCLTLCWPCRKAVSQNKVRWEKEGFSLDLTYLDDEDNEEAKANAAASLRPDLLARIIVLGFPAVGVEHLYRNPRDEVRRFLDTRHPDRYKVFNFCCEPGRRYDTSVFHNRVERFGYYDHGVPPLFMIFRYCESAFEWLTRDGRPVGSAGGRTAADYASDFPYGLGDLAEEGEGTPGCVAEAKERVVALHCKAGKGRAGMMACCLM